MYLGKILPCFSSHLIGQEDLVLVKGNATQSRQTFILLKTERVNGKCWEILNKASIKLKIG